MPEGVFVEEPAVQYISSSLIYIYILFKGCEMDKEEKEDGCGHAQGRVLLEGERAEGVARVGGRNSPTRCRIR